MRELTLVLLGKRRVIQFKNETKGKAPFRISQHYESNYVLYFYI